MGLVDPENNENYNNKNDQSSQDSHMVDEESTPVSDEQQSLLHDGNGDVRIDKGDPHVRRSETQCVAEAEEIWGELEDDAAVFLPPSRHHRAYTTNASGKAYWDEDINGDETTALLRAKTGRSHISRRRMSAPIPPLAVPRMPSRSVASASRSQEALMGRWTWHWWRRPPKGEESAQPEGTSRSESGDQ